MEQYEDILQRMKSTYKQYSGNDVEEAGDIGIRMRVLAGEVFALQVKLDRLKSQVFADTATGEYLDKHGLERGIERKPALKSKGTLTFSLDQANAEYDIEVPQGTICSTAGQNPIRFVTLEQAVIPSGSLSAAVSAQSLNAGAASNTCAGRITVVVTPGIASVSVNNESDFTGGEDAESDEMFRARITDTYKNVSTGSNAAYYKLLALQHSSVYTVSVIPRPGGERGKVDIYAAGRGCLLDNNTIAQIQTQIDELREINVDATVKSPDLVPLSCMVQIAVKDGYTFADVSSCVQQTVIERFSQLEIGKSIYLSEIGRVIMDVDGVENYRFDPVYARDMPADVNELLRLDVLTVSQIEES